MRPQLLLVAAAVMLSTTRTPASRSQVRAVPVQSEPQDATTSYCPVFEERCRCSTDLKEFSCRAAGFTAVPDALPDAIGKL